MNCRGCRHHLRLAIDGSSPNKWTVLLVPDLGQVLVIVSQTSNSNVLNKSLNPWGFDKATGRRLPSVGRSAFGHFRHQDGSFLKEPLLELWDFCLLVFNYNMLIYEFRTSNINFYPKKTHKTRMKHTKIHMVISSKIFQTSWTFIDV